MSSDESDIDLKSAIPPKPKNKMPKSPSEGMLRFEEPKKLSTKMMVRQALIDLKTNNRKGVSFIAIKKYIQETYKVDVERNLYFIKKFIKTAVENGSIIQTKGVGATGSFKLAVTKEKVQKKKKKKLEKPKKEIKDKKLENKEKPNKIMNPKKKENTKSDEKSKKVVKIDAKETKKPKAKPVKEKTIEDSKEKVEKPTKKPLKMVKSQKTPAKKRAAMMKRKSIGSIIKPPKMKPSKKSTKVK